MRDSREEARLQALEQKSGTGIPGLPFDAFEFVTGKFLVPDQDLRISHRLKVEDPCRIVYIPVMKSHECTIYDKRLASAAAQWDRTSVVLRSNMAPVTVWLLLAVLRSDV